MIIERRLARQIEQVETHVREVAIEFERSVSSNVDEKIRAQWNDLEAAAEQFLSTRTGAAAKALLEIAERYNLVPDRGVRVSLPAREPLILRVLLERDYEYAQARLRAYVSRRNPRGSDFEDLAGFHWLDHQPLDSLIAESIYPVLVNWAIVYEVGQMAEKIALPLLDSLTIPTKMRMGMLATSGVPAGRILSIPKQRWAVTELGLFSLDSARSIPVRHLRFNLPSSILLRTETWFDRSAYREALDLARRSPRAVPKFEGWWSKYWGKGTLVLLLLALGTGAISGVVWLLLLMPARGFSYASIVPFAFIAACVVALALEAAIRGDSVSKDLDGVEWRSVWCTTAWLGLATSALSVIAYWLGQSGDNLIPASARFYSGSLEQYFFVALVGWLAVWYVILLIGSIGTAFERIYAQRLV